MSLTQPGTYVLCRSGGNQQYGWPGITIPDDIAPKTILQARPSGYMTLVLLFGTTYQFRWATTSQLSPFVPIPENEQAKLSEELLEAYQIADFGLDACLDIDHWRDEVAAHIGNQASTGQAQLDPKRGNVSCFDEDCDDALLEAMRISLEEAHGKRSSISPTPSSSPPARASKRRHVEVIVVSDDDSDDDDHDDLYSRPSRTISPTTPQGVRSLRLGNSVLGKGKASNATTRTSSSRCNSSGSVSMKNSSQRFSANPLGLDKLLRRKQNAAAPTSDNVESDLTESKDFVRIPVGPDGEVRTLLKVHIWDRPYFRDPLRGIDRFRLNDEDGTYEADYPDLAKLDPADFQFVAEYWTDGDFGVRNPEGPEETKEAIAQCVSAWEAADKLGMFDLLEHIVEKVHFYEWENADVLILAVVIYRSPHEPTEAHLNMRNWISSYLARHFWTYIRDDSLGHLFRRKLKAIPELEREIFEKRAVVLASREDLSDDELGDDDGLEF